MALPTSYSAVAPSSASTSNGRSTRMAVVGTAILLAMVGAVALLTSSPPAALLQKGLAVESPDQRLNDLALHMLQHGATMPVSEMEAKLNAWHDNPETLVAVPQPGAREQMLSDYNSGSNEFSMALADNSLLCKKKDIIIEKFDELLKKLGGEELAANITMGKVSDAFKAAMGSWLDSESTYRLTIEKSKEATEGASFARSEYEKWNSAWKDAKKALETSKKRHDKERADLTVEKELIKEIMRLIGILHDVPATEKSKEAGGTDSVKDSETGVSDPYASKLAKTKAELSQKMSQLEKVNAQLKIPHSATQLAQVRQGLAVYSETEEVAKILKQLLQDIEDRMKIINKVDADLAAEVAKTNAKLVEWEKKLVMLSDAADTAKEQLATAQLTRSKLAGNKQVAEATKNAEAAAYKLVVPPYQREIYVIAMIKKKINDHCAAVASSSR
eukprot:CAMPEP_0181347222 /NCGR_PEP_ID=MMETSP1101-20121128/33765_1 /TAXON_ID=46948 /ORGANISM="Rhodomonas abbreviata, Strain Caron Lab Isolate" /LENGTH=444 /DNA_ID=CAMNT_0023459425 /DNA_START=10 /DNA_END=1344 /DNA_ORIENTATION=+